LRRLFYNYEAQEVKWAIFSDEYGVWFPGTENEWYELSPKKALLRPAKFQCLLADFDDKIKDFDVIRFCPGTGHVHQLYLDLVHDSSLEGRITKPIFRDIAK
jgi:hypothetical protein